MSKRLDIALIIMGTTIVVVLVLMVISLKQKEY